MPLFTLHACGLAQRGLDGLARWQAVIPQAFGDLGERRQITLHAFLKQRVLRAERRVKTRRGDATAQSAFQLAQGRGVVTMLPEQVHGLFHGLVSVESAGAAHLCHGGILSGDEINTSRYISR